MKVLFIAAGPPHWASSRLRMYWPAEHMADTFVTDWAELRRYQHPDKLIEPNDVIVMQKHGWPEQQKAWREAGKLVVWDACDPMWWFSPDESREIVGNVDAVTVSTAALAYDFHEWHGYGPAAHVIPDRLKLSHYAEQRVHADADPVRFIWYGVAANRVALAAGWSNLSRLAANGYNIELTVFDNAHGHPLGFGSEFPVYSQEWTLETENAVIAEHDIALLPPYPGPWGRMKSNNKNLTAIACGLPVTDGQDYAEMVSLVESAEFRQQTADRSRKDLHRWDVRRSSADWHRVFAEHSYV